VYKINKKNIPTIPPYAKKTYGWKRSIETEPDTSLYSPDKEFNTSP